MKKLLTLLIITILTLGACSFGGPDEELLTFNEETTETQYINYTPEELNSALASNNTTLLFFHAAWCPTCRILDGEIKDRLSELPENLIIIKVDYDSATDLRKEYSVNSQHTLIQLDSNGEIAKRWLGGGVDLILQELDLPTPVEDAQSNSDLNTSLPTSIKDVELQEDFRGAKIDEDELLQGCFAGQDCILSIENPKFESVNEANQWLNDSDMVFALNYKGEQRAYSQRILNRHEIVNDELSGDPIAVTFCPLCGSAVAFRRIVDGNITELGVSGFLHNSDLVMYDRHEGNLWQQITGEAIVGPAARRDEVLKQVPIVTTTWGEWKEQHPNTVSLKRPSARTSIYDSYPYGTYEQDDEIYFRVNDLDTTLQIKTPVYGIEINGASKAYPVEALEETSLIEDEIGGIQIRLEKDSSGEVTVTNIQTNETIIPIRLFWFSWAAFHPDTELYTQ